MDGDQHPVWHSRAQRRVLESLDADTGRLGGAETARRFQTNGPKRFLEPLPSVIPTAFLRGRGLALFFRQVAGTSCLVSGRKTRVTALENIPLTLLA